MNTGNLFDQLQKAKSNVVWLLSNEAGLVDFHDIVYWAGVVKRLREQIKKQL